MSTELEIREYGRTNEVSIEELKSITNFSKERERVQVV